MNAFSESDSQETSQLFQFFGEWKANVNAGGSEDPEYWTNPQYLVQVNEYFGSLDARNEDESSSLVVSLMQPYSAQLRLENEGEYSFNAIKFHLYSVRERLVNSRALTEHTVNRKKFRKNELELLDSTGAYSQHRGVAKRCYVSPGYYVIVPSIQDFNVESNFLIRIIHKWFEVGKIFELI